MTVEWMLSSGVLILLMLSVRFLFRKKLPPCLRYALWLVVALRLLLPVSISETEISILNLLPEQDMIKEMQENGSGQAVYEAADSPETAQAEPGDLETRAQAEAGTQSMTTVSEAEDRSAENSVVIKAVEASDIGSIFRLIWLLGAGVCGSIFLVVNLDYGRRLRRSRRRIDSESLPVLSEVPVYETQIIKNPCLFGLFAPTVYVTEEVVKDEKEFFFVLCHENTHYRQHDPWWAFIRIICVCLHWFDPLVWLAARLSRQDGEMACDERTLRMIGDKARIDYGRTLLTLSAEKGSHLNGWRISTTMSGSGRQMKERLRMIVSTPGRTVGIRIFMMCVVIFLSAVTFTGKSMARESQYSEPVFIDNVSGISKTVEPIENKNSDSIPEEATYREVLPVAMSEREYELWREGYTTDGGKLLETDLNFDGRNDLCLGKQYADDVNTPYYCMLWNPENEQYEYSVTLYDVEVDAQAQWISERKQEGEDLYSVTYYRYDEANQLHMVRYREENSSSDALFAQLDLTYVEDDSIYTLPAIVDGTDFHRTLLSMARQALTELYQWTGEKVDTACFQVSNMGSVYFGVTPEDIIHSRTFYDRSFGTDTAYNLSNYDKSISSMYIASGRSVWYSPVLWRSFPEKMEQMSDEEIITWYLERVPLVADCNVKSIVKRYEDMWTVETEEGVWFEVSYDVKLKEIGMVFGPYPDYPEH